MFAPLGVAAVLGLFGTRLGRWLPPATAVPLLTAAAILTALASGFVLAVAGFLVLAQVPQVAAAGRWSTVAVRLGEPVPVAVGLCASLAVFLLLGSALYRMGTAGRDLVIAVQFCRRLGPAAQGLVVIDDDQPDAYAVPGVSGRIVVSTAMLRALSADERRVLLAHESAHLAGHHYLYVQLAELAAAANPLLRPVATAVHRAVERWADEVAAAEVGDRWLAARALARAGVARDAARRGRRSDTPAAAFAVVDGGIADRARALLAGPPRARRGLAAAVAVMVLASAAGAAQTALETDQRLDLAQTSYAAAE